MGRRVIALVAAYAIALSGLIGSFITARAAVASAGNPNLVICHLSVGESPSPGSGDGTDETGANCCSIGCLMLVAALPPPPPGAILALPTIEQPFAPAAIAVFFSSPQNRSHQSRAPPQTA